MDKTLGQLMYESTQAEMTSAWMQLDVEIQKMFEGMAQYAAGYGEARVWVMLMALLQTVVVEGVNYLVLARSKKTGRHGDDSPLAWMDAEANGLVVWEYATEWLLVKPLPST